MPILDEYYGYEGKWSECMRDTVTCPDCGKDFHPTPDNEKYCTRCLAIFEIEMEERNEGAEYDDEE